VNSNTVLFSALSEAATSFAQHGLPKRLRVHNETQIMAWALTYHKDGDESLNHIVQVTGYETWVSLVNTETKE
jgi:hypothetical protein